MTNRLAATREENAARVRIAIETLTATQTEVLAFNTASEAVNRLLDNAWAALSEANEALLAAESVMNAEGFVPRRLESIQ